MKTNILKSFVAMLAIAATVCFAGCKDDESDEDIIPNIAIAESTMSFTNAEETKTLALESNADWQAVVPESADWVTVNPMSGNGDRTVTIAVAENTTGKAREAEVKFSALHPTYGVYDTKKLTIIQSANENEVEEENAIYSDNFDKADGSKNENNQWPAVADCADPKGSAAANVTYKVDGKVTVRNSGKPSSDTDYSSYKGSGVNKVFFGTLPASLVVENIALPADQANYVLSFGANRYDGTAGADNTYKNEELIVSLSKDGVAWTPIEYSFEEGVDLNGKWNLAEASFKLAEVPEALYIKFEAKIASIISIDDIKLSTGGAGEQEVVFAEAPVIEDIEGTVTEVLEAEQGANVKAIDATVVAVSSRAYLLTDGTSYILAYMSEGAPEVAVGDEVTVDGEMGSYNNVPQIINPVATKTGTVENFAQPEATVIDGAALDAYKDNFAIKYVKIADANLVKSGNYWNFTVEGATTTGSLAYPTAEMCPEANSGKKVTVYGYVIYMSGASSQYINVIATSVEVTGEGDAPYEGAEVPETDEADICVDFSNAEVYPEGFPVAKANQVLNATAYTFEGHEFTFAGGGEGNGFYRNTDGYLMLGKKDAYIELPAIEGKALSMVVLTTRKDASKSVQVAIKDAEGNVVEGGKAITLAQLNDKLTYAYALTGTEENTSYRLTVISAHNTQLTHLDLYYTGEGDEPAEPVEMTPAAVAEGYQGAKISWEAVEGAEAYYVYYSLNGEDEVVEVAGDKTEAVITGLTDARKYVFAVEAIDAEENVIGEGETAETEIWTLVNWEEPEFSLTLSEDKSKYVFMVANLVEMNYAYAGATIEILKDGELVYTLKNSTADVTLCAWFDARMNRWPLGSMNNRKDWTWYKGATDEVVSIKSDGNAGEVNSVPASFFTAGEYTLNYSIDYVLGVNTIPCTAKPDYGFEPVASMDVADFLRLPNGRADVLFDEANVPHREVKTNGETPVALATIAPTIEFTSVTAKAEGYQGAQIEWSAVETADAYKVVVNGEEVAANGELSHTVAPETLTDANEYTFTVKAYKGADLLAQKDVKTQVWTLVNTPEPVVTFVDGVLKATNLVDVTGVALKMTVTFTKEGAAEAAYTAYSEHYFNSTSDISININTDQKFKFADFDTFTKWTWDGSTDKANATDAAQTFEPGTYKVAYTAEYYPVVGGIWRDANKVEVASKELAGANGRITYPAAESVYQTYVAAEGEADDVVIADPNAPEPVEMTPAAVAEGYQGAKISWEAVEGAETYTVSVVGNDAITPVEVAGDKTEAVITGLTDARKYTFAVEAIDAEENVIGEGETAEAEVWTLVNWEAPEFELVYNESADTYQLFARNVQEINYIYAGADIKIYKDGAAEPIYTLKNWTSAQYLDNAAVAGRWKLSDMTNRKDWTWYKGATEETATSGEVGSVPASFFEPGVYTLDYTMHYALHVNAKWATHDGSWHDQEVEEGATYLHFYEKKNVMYTDGAVHREPKSNETAVELITIEEPINVELKVKAAIDEGTRNGRELFGSSDANYTGIASINGMLESVKLSWNAVEADKIVIAYNGQTVEVEGTATEKVIEGLKTSPVEFTVSAVKGSETIAEEKVTSDVYVLPEADTSAQWVAKYTESGYQILGTGWNTKQYAAAHVTFNVYEKDSATAVFDKDVNYKGGLGSIIAWAMGKAAPNGVCYAGPGNRACHGGDGDNWDESNLPTGASVVDGKEVFTGLDPQKEYVVKYTLKVWPYIFDASNANNKEPYQSGSNILMNYFFKSMMIGGTADTYYDAVDLQGEADLTFEGVPEPEPEVLAELNKDAYYVFKAATEIKGGKWYAIVSDNKAAQAVVGKNYDYLQVVEGIAHTNGISLPASSAFGFLTTDGGYTIQQYDNKYLYQNGTYNNFNVDAAKPATGAVWSVAVAGSEFTITNTTVNKYVQLDATYGTYGIYDTAKGAKPALYELVEVDNTPMILGVTPSSLAFVAEGGTEDLAVELLNATNVTLSGLTAPFSAEWDATNSVVKVSCENTADAAEQTLTIAVEGGNSVDVNVVKAAAGEINELVVTFPGNPSKYTNAYDSSFDMTLENAYTFTLSAINNGQSTNNWTAVRFGWKTAATVASIATKTAIPYAVSSVKINFTQVGNANNVNSAKLIVANDASFTDVVEEVSVAPKIGEVVYAVTSPAKNLYYKLAYDVAKESSSNGTFRFDKVTFAK